MELLLILTYVAICVGIFKLFKIPLNKWTVPTAFLGGVVLIGAILVLMNYNHPYSEISRSYFATVPIVPEVTGQVTEVHAEPNQIMEEGDILMKLDAAPFEAEVETLEASLVAATADLERAKQLMKTQSIAQRDLDIAQHDRVAVRAQRALGDPGGPAGTETRDCGRAGHAPGGGVPDSHLGALNLEEPFPPVMGAVHVHTPQGREDRRGGPGLGVELVDSAERPAG